MLKFMPATVDEEQLDHVAPCGPKSWYPIVILELELIFGLVKPGAPLVELISCSCELGGWHAVLAEYLSARFFDLHQHRVPNGASEGEPEEIWLMATQAGKSGLCNEKISKRIRTRCAPRAS